MLLKEVSIVAEANAKKQNKIVKFVKEVKSEMKKVVWPSKKQVVNNTLIVIAAVVIVGVIIAVLDTIFQWGLFELLLNRK
ncbi:MAG: preprotein translocase subunit SecE [Clostridia bacterium]|nr:preprotein translocase subunit SecE [Clostridia bacterium]